MRAHDSDHGYESGLRPKASRLEEPESALATEGGALRAPRRRGTGGYRWAAARGGQLSGVGAHRGGAFPGPRRDGVWGHAAARRCRAPTWRAGSGRTSATFAIHNDGAAHESAKSVNAQAYTVGSNIVFQRDKYDPASDAGKHMIAHELTHVVQQRSGPVDGTDAGGGVKISDPSDRFEREAVSNADRLMSAPAAAPAPSHDIQRCSDESAIGSASGRAGGGGRGGDGANVRPAPGGRGRRRVGLTAMSEPARAAKPVNDALADGKRKTAAVAHVPGGLRRASSRCSAAPATPRSTHCSPARWKSPGAEAPH